jgi:ABC-type transport system substrate-binding protein
MLRFFLSRIGQTIAVLFTVSVIIFALMRMIPGDPVLMMLGDDFTPDAYRRLQTTLGLDRSLVTQYVIWLGSILRDPDETVYPELHSTEAWNAGKWVNMDFDRAVELARSENDFKKRKKAYEDCVRAIVEDAPVTILLHVNEQKIFHKYVKGFQMIPANLIDMHRVWLDKA